MIWAEEMSKVLIVGPKTRLPEVLDELHSLKLLHVSPHVKSCSLDIASPLPSHEALSKYVVHLGTVLSRLGEIKHPGKKENTKFTLEHVREKLDAVLPEIDSAIKQRDYLRSVHEALRAGKHTVVAGSIPLDYEKGYSYSEKACLAGFVRTNILDTLKERFKGARAFAADAEGLHAILAYALPEDLPGVKKSLDEADFIPFDITTLKSAVPALRGTVANSPLERPAIDAMVEDRLRVAEKAVKAVLDLHGAYLKDAHAWLTRECTKAELPIQFGATEKTFFARGWIPSKEEKRFRQGLEKATGGEVFIESEKTTPREEAPVKQDLPGIVRPFKHFLDMFAGPLYGEMNPTILIAITFPLFFGFMLGDVGYGLIVLAIALLVNKMLKGKPLLGILPPVALIYASLCTLFFGVMFAEFFGAEIGFYHPVFSRVHLEFIGAHAERSLLYIVDGTNIKMRVNSDALLAISLLVGIVHISIGLVTGFINVLRMRGLKHALLEKLGWMLLMPMMMQIMLTMNLLKGGYAAILTAVLPPAMLVKIFAALGVILVIKSDGITGVVELPNLLTNLFSYARLMAVGLASVLLAVVGNQMAVKSFAGGPVGWIMGIIILLLFHVVNLLLGILSPFLHSLRLHYVEYFTKFYTGGGKRYVPFGAEE